MKKTLMMLAIAACAVQAQAANSTVYRVVANDWRKGRTASALSTLDLARGETKNTVIGGSEPEQNPATGKNVGPQAISKDVVPTGKQGDLALGYRVYLIQNVTSYDNFCKEMESASLWGFESDYKKYLVDTKPGVYDNLYYGNDGIKHLSVQFYNYKDTTTGTAIDFTAEQLSKMVAVMVFEASDSSAAQYIVTTSGGSGDINWFTQQDMDWEAETYYSGKTTGWKDFASIPEPTSGMLMLLGLAGLALKRKRA